mmetsp:Transcript_58117/g.184903  ORF Transcript_58117/g.184903 Transcript_58117/m.184903 type:complete len:229 (+) Transcript_58117:183-869(+)
MGRHRHGRGPAGDLRAHLRRRAGGCPRAGAQDHAAQGQVFPHHRGTRLRQRFGHVLRGWPPRCSRVDARGRGRPLQHRARRGGRGVDLYGPQRGQRPRGPGGLLEKRRSPRGAPQAEAGPPRPQRRPHVPLPAPRPRRRWRAAGRGLLEAPPPPPVAFRGHRRGHRRRPRRRRRPCQAALQEPQARGRGGHLPGRSPRQRPRGRRARGRDRPVRCGPRRGLQGAALGF